MKRRRNVKCQSAFRTIRIPAIGAGGRRKRKDVVKYEKVLWKKAA